MRRKNCCGVSIDEARLRVLAAGSGRRRVRRPKYSNSRSRSASIASFSLRAFSVTNVREALVDEAEPVRDRDRLRERVDLLVANFLVDVRGEQARREPRVLRLFDDERRGRLDRELVELARRRAVVEAADRLGRDAQRVDVREALAAAAHGADDLVDVDGLRLPRCACGRASSSASPALARPTSGDGSRLATTPGRCS